MQWGTARRPTRISLPPSPPFVFGGGPPLGTGGGGGARGGEGAHRHPPASPSPAPLPGVLLGSSVYVKCVCTALRSMAGVWRHTRRHPHLTR